MTSLIFISRMWTCEASESAAKNETDGDVEDNSQKFHPLAGLILTAHCKTGIILLNNDRVKYLYNLPSCHSLAHRAVSPQYTVRHSYRMSERSVLMCSAAFFVFCKSHVIIYGLVMTLWVVRLGKRLYRIVYRWLIGFPLSTTLSIEKCVFFFF